MVRYGEEDEAGARRGKDAAREERAIEPAWGHVGERSLEGNVHESKRGHAGTLQVRWRVTSGVLSVLSF